MAYFPVRIAGEHVHVNLGESAVIASRAASRASDAATSAETAAAHAESMTGPTYASTAAGLAATTDGQGFAVDNGDGTVTVYLNDGGSAVAQRTLATTAALASTDAGKGAALVGFKQSGTGAVNRNIEAKLRESVSVKDFGAVGNGVADDTLAIQAAITSLATSGGVVHVPRGTYKITSTLTLPGRVCLMGEPSGGLTHPSYSATIFNFTGTNSACITHASPYRNAGIHNILIKCNSGANTVGVAFPSALYGNYSNIYVMNATIGFDMTSISGADGIIFNELKNVGARNCTTGIIIDGTLAAHSANQIEVGVISSCVTGISVIECGSTTLGGERGEIGNNTVGINMTGGILTLDGEFWMEVHSEADIIQTGGHLTIAKPFRSLGRIKTSPPGIMVCSQPITPYKVLPTLSVNRNIVNNAYSFRAYNDFTDVMGRQDATLFNGASTETSYRTKYGSGIEFLNTASRRLTLPFGYYPFHDTDWCLGFLVKLAPGTTANLMKLENSDASLDRFSMTVSYNNNYAQYLRIENGTAGSITGLRTGYEWFTDDMPHWFFVGYDASEQKLLTWEPEAGMVSPNATTVPLSFLGSNTQLTVGQAAQHGTFALDEMILFNQIPDAYTLQTIASSPVDLKGLLG
ncbi:hypothetical protein CHH26_05075 [Qipengyuania flava]|uniref:glycosyl hydrolase family 28-related protein n=1 Tax=Qipengyuania flava TaxID=192812 RepID=UPI000B8BC42A|nr:glycosyl hydrolase family 28-related protein [Qipengyuania flava]ASP29673.1 hypothetical protein CHH26_05075 [Qipengyuania flava]